VVNFLGTSEGNSKGDRKKFSVGSGTLFLEGGGSKSHHPRNSETEKGWKEVKSPKGGGKKKKPGGRPDHPPLNKAQKKVEIG